MQQPGCQLADHPAKSPPNSFREVSSVAFGEAKSGDNAIQLFWEYLSSMTATDSLGRTRMTPRLAASCAEELKTSGWIKLARWHRRPTEL
jgi:hypothetical protein